MGTSGQLDLSVIIPVFNEETILAELYKRIKNSLDRYGHEYEILFIDDGSRDSSLNLIRELSKSDHRIVGISLSRNFGQQEAVKAGVDNARGRVIILMDGDLQDPPEVLPQLIAKGDEGWDVVYAIKKKRKENFIKRFAFWSFYRIIRYTANIELPLDSGIFSLMKRKVVDHLSAMPEHNPYLTGLRAWVGFRQTSITYEREARYQGKPKQTLSRLAKLALDGLFSFSILPLRLASILGLLVSGIAFIVLMIILYQKLFTDLLIPGLASVMAAITFLGGVQLLTIGIIGEYIGRIYDEVKQRPPYIISEYIGAWHQETDASNESSSPEFGKRDS